LSYPIRIAANGRRQLRRQAVALLGLFRPGSTLPDRRAAAPCAGSISLTQDLYN
jgi:hypothetical protein